MFEGALEVSKNLKDCLQELDSRFQKIKLNESEINKILIKYEKNIFDKSDGKFTFLTVLADNEERVIKRHNGLKEASLRIQSLIKV